MIESNKQKQQEGPYLSLSASFGDDDYDRKPISADDDPHGDESDGGDEFEFEFEFSIGSPASAAADGGDHASEIFANGRILPVYPVFNRSLLLSSSDPNPDPDPRGLRSGSASSTSSADSLDYCPWAPQSPELRKKSSSTGAGSKRWKVRDLVGGRRSQSDGKEKLVNFSSGSGENPKPNPHPKMGKGEMDLVTAHRLFYGKEKEKGREKGSGKRSFLPYKPELVGLFANSRAHHQHPFNF